MCHFTFVSHLYGGSSLVLVILGGKGIAHSLLVTGCIVKHEQTSCKAIGLSLQNVD